MANTVSNYNPYNNQDGSHNDYYQENGNLKDSAIRELTRKFGNQGYNRGSIVDVKTGKILGQRGSYAPSWYLSGAVATHTGGNTANSVLTTGQTTSSASPGYVAPTPTTAPTSSSTYKVQQATSTPLKADYTNYTFVPHEDALGNRTGGHWEDAMGYYVADFNPATDPSPKPNQTKPAIKGTDAQISSQIKLNNQSGFQTGTIPGGSTTPVINPVSTMTQAQKDALLQNSGALQQTLNPNPTQVAEDLHKLDSLGIKGASGASGGGGAAAGAAAGTAAGVGSTIGAAGAGAAAGAAGGALATGALAGGALAGGAAGAAGGALAGGATAAATGAAGGLTPEIIAALAAAIGGGSSLAAGNAQATAATEAAKIQAAQTDKILELQKQQNAQQQTNIQPWLDAGKTSLNKLGTFFTDNPDFSMAQFQADPGYAFRLSEGMKALQNSAAARGGLLSGNTMKGITEYGQGMASQEYQNAYNRYNTNRNTKLNALQSTAGLGQTAVNQANQASQNYTSGAGNAMMTGANALAGGKTDAASATASGYMGAGSALTNALSGYYGYKQNENYVNALRGGY